MSTSIILLDQNSNANDVDIIVFEPCVLFPPCGDFCELSVGPNSLAKCTVSRNKDNTFSATYRPVEVGLYDVTVLADGEPLEGCPYKVNVINARKVKCTQLYESFMDKDGQVMLQPNKKFSLSFDTSAAGNGK